MCLADSREPNYGSKRRSALLEDPRLTASISSKRVPITDLPRALIEGGYEAANYRRCYDAVVSGTIPAQRGASGRWTFDPENLPQIAEALHLGHAFAA